MEKPAFRAPKIVGSAKVAVVEAITREDRRRLCRFFWILGCDVPVQNGNVECSKSSSPGPGKQQSRKATSACFIWGMLPARSAMEKAQTTNPLPFSVIAILWSRATARKSSRRFRKLSRRSTMRRPWMMQILANIKRWRSETGGGGTEASWCRGFHRWYCHQSGEWPAGKCQETRSGPWASTKTVQAALTLTKTVDTALTRTYNSQRSQPGGWPNCCTWRWRRSELGHVRRP